MKLPAIQFYPADWRKDPAVQSLSYHDRGVWFEIICLMHESEQRGKLLLNGKPIPDEALSRLLGLDKQILTKTINTLLDFGVATKCPDTGALLNRRMIRDEEIRKIRVEAGKLGGNPHLLNQKHNQKSTTMDNQKSTPSSSSSSSSSNKKNISADADEIYSFYPRKEHKHEAIKAITKALKESSKEELIDAVKSFAANQKKNDVETQFIPYPATWFNAKRYLDFNAPKNLFLEMYEKWQEYPDMFVLDDDGTTIRPSKKYYEVKAELKDQGIIK